MSTKLFARLQRCLKTPSKCFVKHIKTYKKHYVLGLFGSFAIVNMIVLFAGLFGALYHAQYHASAAGPTYINPSTFCDDVTIIPQEECRGVVSVYNSNDGQNRTDNNKRGTDPNVCSRNGVVCGIPGHVTHINLPNNNLVGEIPSNIKFLGVLQGINVSYNTISNISTDIKNLSNLTIFNASHNVIGDVGGLDSLVDLPAIQSIDLGYNNISRVPDTYTQVVDTVTYLNLSYNKIKNIAPITNPGSDLLLSLYLAHNQITDIPKNIEQFKKIQYLDLSKNLIEIPESIGSLGGSLLSLNLAHNRINTIPSAFSNFPKNNILLSLNMSYNMLSDVTYIRDIGSLLFLNLSNNQLKDMIPLGHLLSIQTLDLGFNRLSKFPVTELLKASDTLTSFSLRHMVGDPKMEGAIPSDIMNLTHLQNGASQIDYNRLDQHNVTDPALISFLNSKFVNTSNTESYLNTNRRDQYRSIETDLSATLDTVGDIHPGDEIQVTIEYINKSDKDTSDLDLSIYDNPAAFTIQDPTDGFAMIKEKKFDDNDPCKINLRDNTAGKYVDAMNTRATNNGRDSFLEYLHGSERDYDLYVMGDYDPYKTSRGNSFIKRIEQYTYDAFDMTFQGGFNTRLFNMDLNDFAIDGCGIDGKNVTSFNRSPVSAGSNGNLTLTLKIDPSFVGTFSLRSLLESDNRLYIQKKVNLNELPITVKAQPIDSDGDGIDDNEDNCPLVGNPGQEDSNYSGPTPFTFTKADGADRNDSANQDCITQDVCLTRKSTQSLYNAYSEAGFSWGTSPAGTERAYGICADKDTLTFTDMANALFNDGPSYGPPDMIGRDVCLHVISNDTYYDFDLISRTPGSPPGNGTFGSGGFSYTRTEYLDTIQLGDACDCVDTICTTGNDIHDDLICDPVDPACPLEVCGNTIIEGSEQCDGNDLDQQTCSTQGFDTGTLACNPSCAFDTTNCSNAPVEVPLEQVCSLYGAYTGGNRMTVTNLFTLLIGDSVGFTVNNFPYLRYFTAISYMNMGSNSSALGYMNMVLAQQGLLPVDNTTDFRAAVEDLDPMMISGNLSGMDPLQGTTYDQGMNAICGVAVCGNNIIEGNEACDGTNLNQQSCSTFGYSQGTLSCNNCTVVTTNCSNPPVTPPSGGGGSGIPLIKDNCPNGDYTDSYYDHACGSAPVETHQAAPTVSDRPITRKELASLLSIFAKNVLGLVPNINMPCKFSDISKLSATQQNAIVDACRLNIMGVHKNGINIKVDFEPNTLVTKNEFATAFSRMLYDGTYNVDLDSPTLWYTNHVAQIQKIGLLPSGTRVMQSFVLNALDRIQNDTLLVQRSDVEIRHAAATTNVADTGTIVTGSTTTGAMSSTGTASGTVITAPATPVTSTSSVRALLLDLSRFMRPVTSSTGTTATGSTTTGETHGSATTTGTETTMTTKYITPKLLLEDLARFFR